MSFPWGRRAGGYRWAGECRRRGHSMALLGGVEAARAVAGQSRLLHGSGLVADTAGGRRSCLAKHAPQQVRPRGGPGWTTSKTVASSEGWRMALYPGCGLSLAEGAVFCPACAANAPADVP
jgi:hypothetical protein